MYPCRFAQEIRFGQGWLKLKMEFNIRPIYQYRIALTVPAFMITLMVTSGQADVGFLGTQARIAPILACITDWLFMVVGLVAGMETMRIPISPLADRIVTL